jgi:hypothetical protein
LAFRLLLVVVGLAIAECGVRLAGIRPWPNLPPDPGREFLVSPDDEIGWILNPHDHHRAFTGRAMHSETVGSDRLRLVVPSNSATESNKVLILGESSIFGWGLDDDKTFASFLAQRTSLAVENGAVPGYGTLQSMLWMRRLFQTKRAGRVILGYADFMLARDIAERNWVSQAAAVNTDRNIRIPVADIERGALQITAAAPIFPRLAGRQTFAVIRLLEELAILPGVLARRSRKHEIAQAIFTAWGNDLQSAGSRGYVLFWESDGSFERYADFLRTIGVLPMKCVHPEFGSPATMIPDDGHPSAATTAFWAKCVAERLMERTST